MASKARSQAKYRYGRADSAISFVHFSKRTHIVEDLHSVHGVHDVHSKITENHSIFFGPRKISVRISPLQIGSWQVVAQKPEI